MRTFDKVVVTVFVIFGLLAAVFGVGTIVHAYNTTRPQLARLEEQVSQALRLAEDAVAVLDEHPEPLRQLAAPRDSAVDVFSNVHFVVQQSSKVSLQAADALDATAHSLQEIPGVSDLLLPEDALSTNAASLSKTANTLRHLGPRLEELEKSTRQLTSATTQSLQAATQIQDEWVDARVTLTSLLDRLREVRRAFDGANLPVEVARQVSLHGVLFILLAVVLFGMAGMWKRLSASAQAEGARASGFNNG